MQLTTIIHPNIRNPPKCLYGTGPNLSFNFSKTRKLTKVIIWLRHTSRCWESHCAKRKRWGTSPWETIHIGNDCVCTRCPWDTLATPRTSSTSSQISSSSRRNPKLSHFSPVFSSKTPSPVSVSAWLFKKLSSGETSGESTTVQLSLFLSLFCFFLDILNQFWSSDHRGCFLSYLYGEETSFGFKKTSKLREDYLRGGFDRSLFPRVFVSLGVVVLLIVRRITGDLYFTRRVRLKQKQIMKLGTTSWEGEKCRNCGGVIKQFLVFSKLHKWSDVITLIPGNLVFYPKVLMSISWNQHVI